MLFDSLRPYANSIKLNYRQPLQLRLWRSLKIFGIFAYLVSLIFKKSIFLVFLMVHETFTKLTVQLVFNALSDGIDYNFFTYTILKSIEDQLDSEFVKVSWTRNTLKIDLKKSKLTVRDIQNIDYFLMTAMACHSLNYKGYRKCIYYKFAQGLGLSNGIESRFPETSLESIFWN